MAKKKYDILSPDGIPIEMDGGYTSKKKGLEAFKNWKKRFERQGYYSSNNGRIDLKDLADSCSWKEL